MRHYLHELDISPEETQTILRDAASLKSSRGPRQDLVGRHVALYFAKPSVRTRTSFTVGVHELGGHVVELGSSNTKVGKGEHIEDFARVVGRYAHALVARVFAQDDVEAMAKTAGVPVINALSDSSHPCQALADVLTMQERFGDVSKLTFAYVGDGNNVAASTGLLLAALGGSVRVASPEGFELPGDVLARSEGLAGRLSQLRDPKEAVNGAHVVYTDTWISMGQEAEAAGRRQTFADYKVNAGLLADADEKAIVMHCLPAVRDEEIDVETMLGPQSAIWDQAENRLHVQKALLRWLLS